MFLIDAIKPKRENKLKLTLLSRGVELEMFKIKPVLFLFALGLLAATKIVLKRNKIFFFFYTSDEFDIRI